MRSSNPRTLPGSILYEFSAAERLRALRVGAERRAFHRERRTGGAYGLQANEAQALQIDQRGALAELVVATLLGKEDEWVEVTGGYQVLPGDVAPKVQVRSRTKAHYKLILHRSDPDDQAVVAVRLHAAKSHGIVEVCGWMWIADGKLEEFWPGHFPSRPCFMVPDRMLTPGIEGLKEAVGI